MDKLLSGRFIFTIVCAGVFAILSVMGKIPTDKVVDIITLVLMFYFTRTDRQKEETK
jgi:hypothetical protein